MIAGVARAASAARPSFARVRDRDEAEGVGFEHDLLKKVAVSEPGRPGFDEGEEYARRNPLVPVLLHHVHKELPFIPGERVGEASEGMLDDIDEGTVVRMSRKDRKERRAVVRKHFREGPVFMVCHDEPEFPHSRIIKQEEVEFVHRMEGDKSAHAAGLGDTAEPGQSPQGSEEPFPQAVVLQSALILHRNPGAGGKDCGTENAGSDF